MRRLLPPLMLVVLAACTGDRGPATPTSKPSPSSPTASVGTSSPSLAQTPSATPSARPIPPAWAEPILDDLDPEDLADGALVPPGAVLTDRVTLAAGGGLPDQVAVTYALGEDPFAAEHGLAIWQRFPEAPAWSVVYTFVDPPDREVLSIRLSSGDLTGDDHDDVLSFESSGGTGDCGRWRVIATGAEGTANLFKRRTCDTDIAIAGGSLRVREAIFEPGDPHCCPSAFQTSTLEWNGTGFVQTDVRIEETG